MLFDDAYFMQQAFVEAQKAFDEDEIPVGAVIVCQNKIIARAHNLTETLNDVTAHAEMQAITAAANALGGKYLMDCVLYVTLEPCVMCAAALGWSKISRVVFAARDEQRGFRRFSSELLHPKTIVDFYENMEEQSRFLLQSFFKKKR